MKPFDTNDGIIEESVQLTRSDDAPTEIVVGDSVVERMAVELPISLMKIDVEGNEAKVIKGFEKTIRAHQPVVCWEAFTIEKVKEGRDLLEAFGYKYFYHLTTKKSDNKTINRLLKLFDGMAKFKKLDDCQTFEGMNVASMRPLPDKMV